MKRARCAPEILAELREEIDQLRNLAVEAKGRSEYALEVARDMSLPAKMLAFMSWLEMQPPAEDLDISIVLPTRNRPQLLTQAIQSVIAQRYARWRLLVVDDGADPGAAEVVGAFGDRRLAFLRGAGRGPGAARNVGLGKAVGDVVCYLDDDNAMHPGWLQAIANVFQARSDVDVAYGISVAEHRVPDDLNEHGWWPSFWQLPWSRESLLRENVTDIGSIAHRRGLAEANFDEELASTEDWDLLLRLTADREALAIPAISHAYTMTAEGRRSRGAGHIESVEVVRTRHARDTSGASHETPGITQ